MQMVQKIELNHVLILKMNSGFVAGEMEKLGLG